MYLPTIQYFFLNSYLWNDISMVLSFFCYIFPLNGPTHFLILYFCQLWKNHTHIITKPIPFSYRSIQVLEQSQSSIFSSFWRWLSDGRNTYVKYVWLFSKTLYLFLNRKFANFFVFFFIFPPPNDFPPRK